MADTWVDGTPLGQVSVEDRGLQYGDGVFETLRCTDGRVRWSALHWQRLRQGCERLQLPFTAYAALADEVAALAAGQARCLIKAIVTRGTAVRRGYRPQGTERCRRIVSRYEWPSAAARSDFRVGLSPVTLGVNPALAGLKHLNRLEQVLAQQAAGEWDEVLMRSSEQQLIGGSMSNVFIQDEQGWCTPSVERCGVAGVMRQLVLQAAQSLGIRLRVQALPAVALPQVRAAFVTNIRWGLKPVTHWDTQVLPVAADVERLWQVIDAQDR